MLFAEGWGSTKSEPKDELTSLGMMFEENTHLQGLSVHDSFDILTRKLWKDVNNQGETGVLLHLKQRVSMSDYIVKKE